MTVKIIPSIIPYPRGERPKLADAELHFTDGPVAGMKLTGFAVWEHRDSGKRNVTFPAKQHAINGERKTTDFFVPIGASHARDAVRDLILAEYRRVETTVV